MDALWAAFGLAWLTSAFGTPQPGLLTCRGDFAEFARGTVSARVSDLNFVVDWNAPTIFTETGRPGKITAATPISVAFEVQYPDYTAAYWINRRDGSIAEMSNFGGRYWGECAMRPLATRF